MWVICAWFTQIFKRPVSAIINTQTRTVYSQAIFLKPGQGLWDCGGFVVCQCSKAKTMCLGKSKQHLEGRNEMAAMLVVRRLVWDQALSRLTTMPCVCWLASLMQGKSSAYSSSNSFLIFPESSLGLWVTPWQCPSSSAGHLRQNWRYERLMWNLGASSSTWVPSRLLRLQFVLLSSHLCSMSNCPLMKPARPADYRPKSWHRDNWLHRQLNQFPQSCSL